MSVYAKNTSVSVDKSKSEIESTLTRFGASAFAYATNNNRAMIQFSAKGRRIMFVLELPDRNAAEFTNKMWGARIRSEKCSDQEAYKKWEMACRELWRGLALMIKAKLVGVSEGIASFEDEFMAHIVMPDGKTVGHHMRPRIEEAYKSGSVPALGWEK